MTESIILKLDYRGTIKRTRHVPSNLESLQKLIIENFPELTSASIAISYKDEENDTIALTTDNDLQEAYLQLKEGKKTILKLVIINLKEDVKGRRDESAPSTSNNPAFDNPFVEENKEMAEIRNRMASARLNDEPRVARSTIEDLPMHYGVTCDGCERKPIIGNRYKCVICPNYDLCENCETKGIHGEHSLMKIRSPGQANRLNSSQVVELDIPRSAFPEIMGAINNINTSVPNPGIGQYPQPQGPWGWHRGYRGGHHGGHGGFGGWGEWKKNWEKSWNKGWGKGKWGEFGKSFGGKKKAKKMGVLVGGEEKRRLTLTSAPGVIREAKWQLKNESPWPWPANVTVNKRGGNIEFEPILIQGGFQSGQLIDLNIPILAPSQPGTYKLKLALCAEEGYRIGKCLRITLTVNSSAEQPMMELEEEVSQKAFELEKQGFGSFETCFDALMAEKGNVEAAKKRCSKEKTH